MEENSFDRAPKIERKKEEKGLQVPPLPRSTDEYREWVPPVSLTAPSSTQAGLEPRKPMI